MVVRWPKWDKLINDAFIPLIECEDRFLIMYGSRDSTKTSFTVRLLIYRCLTLPYFKCVMIRRHYAWIRGSVYSEVKETIIELGLESIFKFRENPYEIECTLNGNKFIGRGADNVKSIKGVKNPSCMWYEEDIVYIPEDDWTTIVTSTRSSKAPYLQDIYTINPQVEGQDYNENWFYKRFFTDYQSKGLSYRGVENFKIGSGSVELAHTVHHSTWKDNKWITPDRVAIYKQLKERSTYFGAIFVDGLWCNKTADGLFYYGFHRGIHVQDCAYDNERPIHLTFDFNVRPYVSASVWQVYDADESSEMIDTAKRANNMKIRPKILVKVGEIASKPPRNRTKFACEEFTDRFRTHKSAVYLYGDPAGKHEDTRSEDGSNDFDIIMKELKPFNPKKRISEAAPNVASRGEFINNILSGLTGFAIMIDGSCTETIKDYTNGKEDDQGRKLKEKTKGDDGIRYEKYHHFTDGDDYFITKFLNKDFKSYIRGGKSRSYQQGSNFGFSAR